MNYRNEWNVRKVHFSLQLNNTKHEQRTEGGFLQEEILNHLELGPFQIINSGFNSSSTFQYIYKTITFDFQNTKTKNLFWEYLLSIL